MPVYSGVAGVWATAVGDFTSRNFPGTGAGLQAAADYAGSGGTVWIGAGTFDISSSFAPSSNQVIRGAGMGATILRLANAANTDTILISGKTNITIRDLTIDGNKANNSVAKQGIRCTTSTNIRVERVHAHDCEQDGFYFSGCTDVVVQGCVSESNGRNGFSCGDANGRSTRVRFFACTSMNHETLNTDIGYSLEPASFSTMVGCVSLNDAVGITCFGGGSDNSTYNTISSCEVIDFSKSGIIIGPFTAGVAHITVANCLIRPDASLSTGLDSGILFSDADDVTIIGNRIGPSHVNADFTGINALTSPNRFLIMGNQIEAAGFYAIQIASGQRGLIVGNIWRNADQDAGNRDGCQLTDCTDVIVVGNLGFDDQGGSATQNYGLDTSGGSATSDRITVVGNIFRGNTQANQINLIGTDNRVDHNVGILQGTATYDPANLVDGAGATTTVTVTGCAMGDFAEASFSNDLQGITLTAWVSAAGTVSVRFQNETGGAIDLASGTLKCRTSR